MWITFSLYFAKNFIFYLVSIKFNFQAHMLSTFCVNNMDKWKKIC